LPTLRNSTGIAQLAVESPLAIEVNGIPVATLICTPGSGDELVAGWCYGQGFLDSVDDIARISCGHSRATIMLRRSLPGGHDWREQLTSGFDASLVRFPMPTAGGPPPRDEFEIEAGQLLALVAELQERFRARPNTDEFEHVGATDGHSILVTTYDVERFNAIDKLVGWSVLASEPLHRMIVTLSGRICAASIFRLARAGVKIVVANRTPTAQAVKFAQGAGVTLVGGLASGSPIMYSHPWRIDRR
jgi:FdhD protein